MSTPTTSTERPRWEVADVIGLHGEAFLARHGATLTSAQRRALRDLAACRTAALGGHVERCGDCGHERPAYNSCRNRHCPKCQALTRARWLQREAGLLLSVDYYHVVFTLPAEAAALALANPRQIYNLLFEASARALRQVAADRRYLGAEPGWVAVLHTWGQDLHHHPHLHCVVTGGGLACDGQGRRLDPPCWRSCRPGFFLPVRLLSRAFRGHLVAGLRQAFAQGRLALAGGLAALAAPAAFAAWLAALLAKDWVVYAKPPFGGPAQVLGYLARYTHRVAISNGRLLEVSDRGVAFAYKDYADHGRQKVRTLSGEEFLRRFLQHVLPRGLVKVRHYGLLANRRREADLAVCRRLLAAAAPAGTAGPAPPAGAAAVGPAARPTCPRCGSDRLLRLPGVLAPVGPAAGAAAAGAGGGPAKAIAAPNSS